jgi:hypothetical protein
MPYGLPKPHNTKKNEQWMERCVTKVMKGSGAEKGKAIAVCKTQLKKKGYDASKVDMSTIILQLDMKT